MSYVKKNLMEGETILHQARKHWWIFVKPVVHLILGTVLLVWARLLFQGAEADGEHVLGFFPLVIGALLALGGLFGLASALLEYISTELAVTSHRLIVKYGFIRRHTMEMSHRKVESMSVQQGILGRIFNFGTVIISGTGGTPTPYHFIAAPLALRRAALEAEESQPTITREEG